MRTFFRVIVFASAAMMLVLGVVLSWSTGRFPASIPTDGPQYALSDLSNALISVDARGQVDLTELKKRHESIEHFMASLARVSPQTEPERFPAVEDRLAYWLNVHHAMVLLELLDTRSSKTSAFREAFDTHPIGGHRLSRAAIVRNELSPSGDARVFLSIFTGAKGAGVIDGAPFDGESLNLQLDDAVRRFVRRADHFRIEGKVVHLSELFREHQQDFLEALPEGRKNVLQIVWAYLPETCDDDKPGCETRSDLDRACGPHFDACTLDFVPVDPTLSIKN